MGRHQLSSDPLHVISGIHRAVVVKSLPRSPVTLIECQPLFLMLMIWCVCLQEIPPFETKGVMRASFSSRDADNHTAFIRIKTNASNEDEFIILPMEVEVTAGQFSSQNEEGLNSSSEMRVVNPFEGVVRNGRGRYYYCNSI